MLLFRFVGYSWQHHLHNSPSMWRRQLVHVLLVVAAPDQASQHLPARQDSLFQVCTSAIQCPPLNFSFSSALRAPGWWLLHLLSSCYFVCVLSSFSCVQLFETPWTIAHQAPLSKEFSRQEYWSGLPCPSQEDLPDPGIEPPSLYISCTGKRVLYH